MSQQPHDELVRRALALLQGRPSGEPTLPEPTVPEAVRRITPAIQEGDRISWISAGKPQEGKVDFVHVDPDGISWAFVTIGESWAAVNLKYASKMSAG